MAKFQNKKNNDLELTSTKHEYTEKGKYKIMVKVVDILGIDTSQVVEVEINRSNTMSEYKLTQTFLTNMTSH